MAPSSDLLDHYKLEAHQVGDSVIHYSYRSNRASGLRKSKVEEKWDNVKPIGYGSFGEVWQQKRNSSSEQRAVKVLRKQQMKSWGINYEREIEALAKFDKAENASSARKKSSSSFFGWWESEHSIHLAMEYFEERDLSTFISEAKTLERDAKDIAGNLLQALVMIHSQGFTHRDLKPQNIFVVQTSPRYWVKLGDFGISKRMSNQSTALRTEVGTRAFSAPETTPDDYEETFQYTNAVDMWSLGCVIYNVLAHSLPYRNNRAKRFPFPTQPLKDRVNDQGINFLECLLRVDPSIRWTAQKAAQHPWLEASCEASSAAVKDGTEDSNSVAQPERPNESQNKRHHPDDQVDKPTNISSMEKTCPRLADPTEAPTIQLASQSSSHHGESSQADSGSNSDGRRRTRLDRPIPLSRRYSPPRPIPPSKYRTSDCAVDEETETLEPHRAGYCLSKITSHDLHQNDTTKKPTASPGIRPKVSGALEFGRETSYGSSNVADEGATQGEPLIKAHHPALAVRRRQESEEQDPQIVELLTTLRALSTSYFLDQNKYWRVLELLRKGVDLEVRSYGETALHLAVRICYSRGDQATPILLELFQTGADVDARNENGETALHVALSDCSCGLHDHRIEVVKQLIRYKADVNAKDHRSWTPLHYAAFLSSEVYIDVLVAAGARVNELTSFGNTALHKAPLNRVHGKVVAEKLILAGIDMNITDNSCKTALDVAHRNRNLGVVAAIEEAQRTLRWRRGEYDKD